MIFSQHRTLVFFVITIACLLVSQLLLQSRSFLEFGIDDAQIFIHYADNLLTGKGLVWNQGELPVEGFSSPLWLIVVTFVELFGATNLEPILKILSTLLIAIAVARILSVSFVNNYGPLVCILLVASSPAFVLWQTLSLMDITLWSALILLAIAEIIKPAGYWKGILIALCLTRSEALILVPVLLILRLILMKDYQSKSFLYDLALVLTLFTLLLIARYCYFGYIFPNTYYAKVDSDLQQNLISGLVYLKTFIFAYPLIAIAWIVCLINYRRYAEKVIEPLIIVIIAIYVSVGGDHFAEHRHYQLIPLLSAVALVQISSKNLVQLSCCLLIVIQIALNIWNFNSSLQLHKGLAIEFELARSGIQAGKLFSELYPKEQRQPLLAAIAIGGLARSYTGKTFDLMGLNNLAMAHAKRESAGGIKNHSAFNMEIFWSVKPDYLLHFGPDCRNKGALESNRFVQQALHGLTKTEKFKKNYQDLYQTTTAKLFWNNYVCGYVHNESQRELPRL